MIFNGVIASSDLPDLTKVGGILKTSEFKNGLVDFDLKVLSLSDGKDLQETGIFSKVLKALKLYSTSRPNEVQMNNLLPIVQGAIKLVTGISVDSINVESYSNPDVFEITPFQKILRDPLPDEPAPIITDTEPTDIALALDNNGGEGVLDMNYYKEKRDQPTETRNLYIPECDLGLLLKIANPDNFLNYTLLSDDPLVWHVLESFDNSAVIESTIEWHGLALTRIDDTLVVTSELLDTYRDKIGIMRQDGAFSVKVSSMIPNERIFLEEIGEMFEFGRYGSYTLSTGTVMLFRDVEPLKPDPSMWMKDTMVSVLAGQSPSVIIHEPIITSALEGVDPGPESQIRVYYLAMRACADFIELDMIPNLYVYPDLQINLPVYGRAQISSFKETLNRLAHGIRDLYVRQCSSLIDCVLLRLKISEKYPEAVSLGIPTEDKQRYYLVSNAPLGNLGPEDLAKVIGYTEADESRLTERLRQLYLSRCGTNFGDRSLIDILSVISIPGPTGEKCFVSNDLGPDFEYFDQKDYSALGWTSLGWTVPGLELSGIIPYKRTEISEGTIVVEPISKDIDLISVRISDDELVDLFTLQTGSTKKDLSSIVQRIWKRGDFVNSWGKAYYEKTGKISRVGMRTIDVLQEAGYSKEGTDLALRWLSQI